jgi:K+/H+ antiporter YhaU regulatory subunit KhtT
MKKQFVVSGIGVIANKQKQGSSLVIPPTAEDPLKENQVLVSIGKNKNLQRFEDSLAGRR